MTLTNKNETEDLLKQSIMGFGSNNSRKTYYNEYRSELFELSRFRTLLNQISEGIFFIKTQTLKIFDVNSTVSNLTGVAEDIILETEFSSLFIKKDRNEIFEFISAEADVNKSVSIRTELLTKELTNLPVELNVNFTEFESEIYAVVLMRDIRKRIVSENAIKNSEEQFRQFAENIPGVVFIYDMYPDGRRKSIYSGPGLDELLGKRIADRIRYDVDAFMDLVPERDYLFLQKAADQSDKDNSVLDQEYRLKLDNNNQIWVRSISRISKGKNGIIRRQGILLDVSSKVKAEKALEELNYKLETKVNERTEELNSAYKELKDFAYVVSHDLKTPLRGISQISKWLSTDYVDDIAPEGVELFEMMIARIKHLEEMIDGILQYSKIGRICGEKSEVYIKELVEQLKVEFVHVPDLEIRCSENIPGIFVDRIRIEQLFMNLISNSVNYNDKDIKIINIDFSENENYYEFSVKDNGIGIDPKYHDQIFGVFKTLNSSTDEATTGIGLAIVKKIIEYYGGNIIVESVPNQYTNFIFTLAKEHVSK